MTFVVLFILQMENMSFFSAAKTRAQKKTTDILSGSLNKNTHIVINMYVEVYAPEN